MNYEAPICAAAVAKLRADGWRVVCEVSINYSPMDAAALRDGKLMAVEAKVSLNNKLRYQLYHRQLVADYVLGVVGSKPRSEGIEWCAKEKIGLWLVRDGVIAELVKCGEQRPNEYYRKAVIERMDMLDEATVGGLPNLLGVGAAQEVQRGVDEYRAAHPNATWKEIHANVPSHYRTPQNMYSALRSNAERLAFRARMKQRRMENDQAHRSAGRTG